MPGRFCRNLWTVLVLLAASGLPSQVGHAQQDEEQKEITLLVTETLEANGLLGHLLPTFEERSGIRVNVIARASQEAIRLARAGHGDVLWLDDFEAEEQLVRSGVVAERRDVMYTELLVVGPQADPAGIGGMVSVIDAFRLVARSQSPFISRGDESGTHHVEIRIWDEAGMIPSASSNAWFTVTEADMRTTLGLAAARNAYTLTDRATWLNLRNRRRMRVLVTDDPRLMLRFGVSVMNPEEIEDVREREARAFLIWITSEQGQEEIGKFEIAGQAPYTIQLGLQNE